MEYQQRLAILAASIILLTIPAAALSQDFHEADSLALLAAQDLEFLVDESNYESMGFKSVHELQSITLGTPIPVHFVGLTDLKRYDYNDTPAQLLNDIIEIVYPVLVNGEARSAIVVSISDDGLEVSGFGKSSVISPLVAFANKKRVGKSRAAECKEHYVIEIPAIFLTMLCHFEDDKLAVSYIPDESGLKEHPEDLVRKALFDRLHEDSVIDSVIIDKLQTLARMHEEPLSGEK